jgi:hypothetical protein
MKKKWNAVKNSREFPAIAFIYLKFEPSESLEMNIYYNAAVSGLKEAINFSAFLNQNRVWDRSADRPGRAPRTLCSAVTQTNRRQLGVRFYH